MTNHQKLVIVKAGHSLVWVFYNIVIFYFLYALIIDRLDQWAWLCLFFILGEIATLLMLHFTCPFTIWAEHYSKSKKDNFDIYLPNWFAHWNKTIYGAIIAVEFVFLAYRLII